MLPTYTAWKQSSYYTEAVKVVGAYGGSVMGSFSSANKTGVSNGTSSADEVTSSSLDSNATITFPPSSSSSTIADISESDEQDRFDQALAAIKELQKLHPHANFSVNSPFVLLTSEEFLAYVNRYAVDPDSNPIKTSTSGSVTSLGDGGPLTTDSQGSNSSIASSQDGGLMTSSAAAGEIVDWENAGCVTAVKDQGECGACWAFSATAAMESGYCVASGGSLPSLSDQELISCDNAGESNGCGGGYAAYTIDWIANDRGGKMCTLDSYPFTSDDGNVPSCSMSSCTEVDIGVTGYKSVREDAGALEDAVRSRPVSIFLYSGSSAFQYYSGGVLTGENCDKTGSHSGLAVGFGETDDGVIYWRIKNQWGTSWGEDGYVRVERRYSGDSEGACGVELYATWPTFDSTLADTTSAPTTTSPSATTSVPSTTTPSVTTATPTTAPTITTAPATTTATPTTETPSATETVQGKVVYKNSIDNSVYSITETPSTTTATPGTETPSVTETVQNEAIDDANASNPTEAPSETTAPSTIVQNEVVVQNAGSESVAGEASYSTTPSPSNRDCAM
ncbi:hypothetical protein BBO99_00002182 [Phytophthora kernoviae]|uniref:Peptidase C1A papain C-terminal domain-containing protein n=2 Tax=Phytophthora kernoviae TaxID=325452 RepID=A0A3R7JAD8_9STRA|nr:hypothetical protein G195_002496 [Phytophthora kernoviae 00238/432]KAG2531223.1 hypothetical protein JM18_001798 [Phytophthora kernoviae]RLN10610.1 hypothetical protein BBI17_001898 [Phytophthora kernoviae]RLN83349.1 hypothetical protein BBO99_00002182 [Phytophthora kernoviae]